jgi:succinate dehydrogenase membrane anchor subunit
MSFRTDRQRVTGLGSAHEGTSHWMGQRLTAVAMVPLTLLFIFPLSYNLGAGYERVLEAYSHPVNAIVAVLFFITLFRHLQLGLQVVIEDYVPGKAARTVLLLANVLFCWLFGLTGVFAVVKIAISA